MRVMAIINPFNDNNHTNNNHIVITIYVILRRAMSIGNRYLHFCKREGGRVFIFCVDTLTHARTHTLCTQTQLHLRAKGTSEFQFNIVKSLSCSGGRGE